MRATSNSHFYFLWIFILSIPFYLVGILELDLLPVGLPISALMVLVPAFAVGLHRSNKELMAITRSSFGSVSSNIMGYLVALFTIPCVMTATYFFMKYTGTGLPSFHITPLDIPKLTVLFFIGAVMEEIGWTGYATAELSKKHGILYTGLVVGFFWAIWHLVPYIQMGRELNWIIWQGVASLLMRVIMVWLFVRYGRSILQNVLFHTTINISAFLFPRMGSHYDPFYFSLILLKTIALSLLFQQVWKIIKTKPETVRDKNTLKK